MTRWAPGITMAAISRDGGASATHGELSSKSKYTAPVRRTDAQHVRQDVGRHAGPARRTRGHPVRTLGQVGAHIGRPAMRIGRSRMAAAPETSRSVSTCRATEARGVERISL